MPRRTPVKELQKEEPVVSSPLRRSSRLNASSPVPTNIITRRNSSSEQTTSTPKATRGRRSSLTQDTPSNEEPEVKRTYNIKTRRSSLTQINEDQPKESTRTTKTRASSVTKEQPEEEKKTGRRRRSASEEPKTGESPKRVTRAGSITRKKSDSANQESPKKEQAISPKDGTPIKKPMPKSKISEKLESVGETKDESSSPDEVKVSKGKKRVTEVHKVDFDLSIISEASNSDEEGSPQKNVENKKENSVAKSPKENNKEKNEADNEVVQIKDVSLRSNPVVLIESCVVKESVITNEEEKNAGKLDTSFDKSFNLQLSTSVLENNNKNDSGSSNKENICPRSASLQEVEPMEVDEDDFEITSPIEKPTNYQMNEDVIENVEKVTYEIDFLTKSEKHQTVDSEKKVNGIVPPEKDKTREDKDKFDEETEEQKAEKHELSLQVKTISNGKVPSESVSSVESSEVDSFDFDQEVESVFSDSPVTKKDEEVKSSRNESSGNKNKVETSLLKAINTRKSPVKLVNTEKSPVKVVCTEKSPVKVVCTEKSPMKAVKTEISPTKTGNTDLEIEGEQCQEVNASLDKTKPQKKTPEKSNDRCSKEKSFSETVESLSAAENNDDEKKTLTAVKSPRKSTGGKSKTFTTTEKIDNSEKNIDEKKSIKKSPETHKKLLTANEPEVLEENDNSDEVDNNETSLPPERNDKESTNTNDYSFIDIVDEEIGVSSKKSSTGSQAQAEDVESAKDKTTEKTESGSESFDSFEDDSNYKSPVKKPRVIVSSYGSVSKDSENDSFDRHIDKKYCAVSSPLQKQLSFEKKTIDSSSESEESVIEIHSIDVSSPRSLQKPKSIEKSVEAENEIGKIMSPGKKVNNTLLDGQQSTENSMLSTSMTKQMKRKSVTLQETVKAGDDEEKPLSGHIHKVVEVEKEVSQIVSPKNKDNSTFVDDESSVLSNSAKKQTERKSITLQETIKAGDDAEKALSGRIHKVVDLFCAGLKNKSDVSINVSMEYTGQFSDSEGENSKTLDISLTAAEITDSVPKIQTGSKRRKICHSTSDLPIASIEVSGQEKSSDISTDITVKISPKKRKSSELHQSSKDSCQESASKKRRSVDSVEDKKPKASPSNRRSLESQLIQSSPAIKNRVSTYDKLEANSDSPPEDHEGTELVENESFFESSNLSEQVEETESEAASSSEEESSESSLEDSKPYIKLISCSFDESDMNDTTWCPSDSNSETSDVFDAEIEEESTKKSSVKKTDSSSSASEEEQKDPVRKRRLFRLSTYDVARALDLSEFPEEESEKLEKKSATTKQGKQKSKNQAKIATKIVTFKESKDVINMVPEPSELGRNVERKESKNLVSGNMKPSNGKTHGAKRLQMKPSTEANSDWHVSSFVQ